MRWRLDVAYDGTDFAGWAAQPDRRTVQGELETWITRVLRLDATVHLVCAGRTDAGVHARGQVAHLDLPDDALADGMILVQRLARALDHDVVVRSFAPAPAGFDARFAAEWRRYTYRLWDAVQPADPLRRRMITRLPGPVDVELINTAAASLLGLRDFAPFCRRREGATTIRTLLDLAAARQPDGVVEVTVRADAFCHSMVRSLVGALVAVGSGRRDLGWLESVAGRPDRDPDVQVLPAHGLTLEEVGYPPDELLAARAAQSRAVRSLS